MTLKKNATYESKTYSANKSVYEYPLSMPFMSRLAEFVGKDKKMTQSELARRLKISASAVNQWIAGGNTDYDRVEEVAKLFGVSPSYLIGTDASEPLNSRLPVEAAAPPKPTLPWEGMALDVPVWGTAAGAPSVGEGAFEMNQGDVINYVRRGPGITLNRGVFAIYVQGDSMSPWREEGGLVYLDPAKPARPGDHVVIVVGGAEEGMPPHTFIKKLVRRTADHIITEQYNPRRDIKFDAHQLRKLIRVLEWEEVMGL